MTEFSTKANLDVTVSERSLSDARNQIESRLGSVRAGVASTDGGRTNTAFGGLGDRLGETNDLLVQIRDILDDQAFESAGGGGGGGGGGLISALGTVLLGGTATTALSTTGITLGGLGLSEFIRQTLVDDIKTNSPGRVQQPSEGAGVPLNFATDPLTIGQNIAEGFGLSDLVERAFSPDAVQTPLTSALRGALTNAGEVLQTATNPGQIGQNIGTAIASTVTQGVQFDEPGWLSDLRSLFGGGGGGGSIQLSQGGLGGGESFASGSTSPTVGGGDSTRPGGQVNVSLEAGGLQRDLERSIQNALGDLQNNRAFQRAVVAIVRETIT